MPKASCCICRKTWSKEKIRLFHAPKNQAKRKIWSEACGFALHDSSRICENHFLESDFNAGNGDHSPKRRRLKPTAVPSSHFKRMLWKEQRRDDDFPNQFKTDVETDFSEDSKSLDKSSIISNTPHWSAWCRLCAKEDPSGSSIIVQDDLRIDETEEEIAKINEIIAAVEKYFSVKVNIGEFPRVFCERCCSLIRSMEKFSERVSKVQQMYLDLHNAPGELSLDTHELRIKYGLLDEDDYNTPEIQPFESKFKSNEDLEVGLEESTNSNNPVEQINLAKEDMLGLIIDELEENLSEYGENEIVMDNMNINFNEESETDQPEEVIQDIINESEDELDLPNQSNIIELPKNEKEYFEDFYTDDDHDQYDVETVENENVSISNYTCTDCSRQFTHHRHLRMHMRKAHSKTVALPELPCKHCTKVFPTPHQLDVHSKVHLPLELKKTVPCPYCEKKFSSQSLVQLHIKFIHMNERPFICDECGTTVRTKTDLKSHMLTHTDYAPFECDVCKRGFKSTKRLKKHMDIHDPNKHICAECGLQLNSRATLTNHLAVHSDEKQYKCDYCGRAFKRAKAFKNHLLIHTGLKPYSCDFCHRTFAIASSCRSHKKRIHPAELAALEATGASKSYTKNIPKLETLKEIIKSMDNLTPVRERRKELSRETNEYEQKLSREIQDIPKEQTSIVSVMAPDSAEALISFTVALN